MRRPIESEHRKIRKEAKNKFSFPKEQALGKRLCLAIEEAARKWTMRHKERAMISSQLMVFFEDRLTRYMLRQKLGLHRKPYTPNTGIPKVEVEEVADCGKITKLQ